MGIFETLNEKQKETLLSYLEEVIEINKSINLTRIETMEEGLVLHIEDSLEGLSALNQAPEGLYGDLGSGGGFPGVPLAIASGRETVLVDARAKKMKVVRDIIDKIGLSTQITTCPGRAELLARKQPCSFAVLTARALAKLSVLLELASPLLKQDGMLVCFKAQVQEEELADARRVLPLVGMELQSDRSFLLNGEYQRRIITFKKTDKPKVKLPRQEGQAQKNPL